MGSNPGMRLSGDIPDVFRAIQDWLRSSPPIDESGPSSAGPPVSFVDLWQRVAVGGMDELSRSLPAELAAYYRTDHKAWAEYRDIHRDLSDDLIIKLSVVGEPAVWERFNSRRTPRDVVMAHLGSHGRGCSRVIYCSVLEKLRSDGLQSLTTEYPVLRRHLAITVAHWLSSSREILTRVHSDRQLLVTTFDLLIDARLTGIRQNLSDPHRGGRTVAILTFASDASACGPRSVVYKPKDLRIDQAFHRLMSEVPAPTPADGALQSITVVARADYGYMEYVPHKICLSTQELRSFYRNAGRLTAILYLLGCNDCHNENSDRSPRPATTR